MSIKKLTNREIVELAKNVVLANRNTPSTAFSIGGQGVSYDAMHEVLRQQLRLLAPDYYGYKENKYQIFQILTETIDAVLPKTVLPAIGRFAEVKTVKQGDKPEFKKKLGNSRAKGFISKAGLAGTYNVFRLDSEFIEVTTTGYGGACQISIEEFLDGRADFSELLQIVLNELEGSIYRETRYAMESLATTMPVNTNNKLVASGFNADALSQLIRTVRSYGSNAQILATEAFASKIRTHLEYISDADKNDMRNQGFLGKFMGVDVLLLPNAYEDEKNIRPVFQDRYAYVVPTGSVGGVSEKIVKVALEGNTIIEEYKNRDLSMEMQVYKKMGIAIVTDAPYLAIYEDTDIPFIQRARA